MTFVTFPRLTVNPQQYVVDQLRAFLAAKALSSSCRNWRRGHSTRSREKSWPGGRVKKAEISGFLVLTASFRLSYVSTKFSFCLPTINKLVNN